MLSSRQRSMSDSVFLSYARADEGPVADVAAKLRARGHRTFFDKKSLEGELFDRRIRQEVESCDLFVFFASEASLRSDSYALTELGYAEQRWPDPSAGVLAIRVGDVQPGAAPSYLRANVTLQTITGNFATGVCDLIVDRLTKQGGPQTTTGAQKGRLLGALFFYVWFGCVASTWLLFYFATPQKPLAGAPLVGTALLSAFVALATQATWTWWRSPKKGTS
jgi:hypothetical protein